MKNNTNLRASCLRDIKIAAQRLARERGNSETIVDRLLADISPEDFLTQWKTVGDDLDSMLRQSIEACRRLSLCQTIIFSSDQAKVFESITSQYADSFDYQLPYQNTFIQFSTPLPWKLVNTELSLVGLCLSQNKFDSGFVVDRGQADDGTVFLDRASEKDASTLNQIVAIFWREDFGMGNYLVSWKKSSAAADEWIRRGSDGCDGLKNLAIACIGYINCENIYLYKEGEVPDAVNRKRAKQGKKVLEPYYTCRIRGVQYDSNGEPTGEGTHHGFRYDVRGHFRKLTTGKTTWVRPHQRGLQHELYIPKTYVVEQGAKVFA